MTIGIGVLATTDEGRQRKHSPDMAVLIADTMGSYGDVDSHDRVHKIILMPEDRLYGVIADQVDRGSQLMPCIASFLRDIPKGERTYGKIQMALAKACFEFKGALFTMFELPKLRLAPQVFNPNQKLEPELNAQIQQQWQAFSMGCDLVVAIFDDQGMAYLFELNAVDHTIYTRNFPGFAAIGSGSDNALFWLAFRQHTQGNLPLRAAYHAYEAKISAEGSAHVNEHLDILIATGEEHWFCTTHKSLHGIQEHPEINLPNLKRLHKQYGIRKTEKLGTVPMKKGAVNA